MYMSNTISKRKFFKIILQKWKAYKVPLQFPVTACIDYNDLTLSQTTNFRLFQTEKVY